MYKPTPEEKCECQMDGDICKMHQENLVNAIKDGTWCVKHDCYWKDCVCIKLPSQNKPSPSPEARCEHNWGSWAGEKFEHNKCCLCGAYKVPPDARVDWEKEAMGLVSHFYCDDDHYYSCGMVPECANDISKGQCTCGYDYQVKRISKALSAAFEKGREKK
jgi:hypothetical protein